METLLILLLCLLFSAFFSSAETAYTAVNQIKLRNITKDYPKYEPRLTRIYRNPRALITAILVGNNVANVATSAIATKLLLDLFTESGIQSVAIVMTLITVGITILLLIFGEITPKTYALKNADKLVRWFSLPIQGILYLFRPIIWAFDLFSWIAGRLFKFDSDVRDTLITVEDVKSVVELGTEEGVIEEEKDRMIRGVFDISDTVVREIMTPRTDAVCISGDSSIEAVVKLIMEKGHSRIPVYDDKLDNIIGIVYAKDLLVIPDGDREGDLKAHLREAIFTPETKNIEELLRQMQESRFHMAVVVDEHGGMAGVVTLEDIVEEIVGEIEDEYDPEGEDLFSEIAQNKYLVDASINIEELSEKLDLSLEDSDEYDTLGGFILLELGELPKKGDRCSIGGMDMQIREIRKRRIKKVVLSKTEPESDTHSEA